MSYDQRLAEAEARANDLYAENSRLKESLAACECDALRSENEALQAELGISGENMRLALTEIATLREGRDLARQAGAELVEEVRALREALRERSQQYHTELICHHQQTGSPPHPGVAWGVCMEEPCVTDKRLTQEERDG